MLGRDAPPKPAPPRPDPPPLRPLLSPKRHRSAHFHKARHRQALGGSRGSAEGQTSLAQRQTFRRLIACCFHVLLKQKTAINAFNK